MFARGRRTRLRLLRTTNAGENYMPLDLRRVGGIISDMLAPLNPVYLEVAKKFAIMVPRRVLILCIGLQSVEEIKNSFRLFVISNRE